MSVVRMLTNWQQEWVIWAGHQTELTVCRTGRPLGTWGNCPNRREVISLVQECFRDAYTGMITCCRSRKMSVLTPDFFLFVFFFSWGYAFHKFRRFSLRIWRTRPSKAERQVSSCHQWTPQNVANLRGIMWSLWKETSGQVTSLEVSVLADCTVSHV